MAERIDEHEVACHEDEDKFYEDFDVPSMVEVLFVTREAKDECRLHELEEQVKQARSVSLLESLTSKCQELGTLIHTMQVLSIVFFNWLPSFSHMPKCLYTKLSKRR